MSCRNERIYAKESGTNFYKKILIFNKELMATTSRCKDRENSISLSFSQTKESSWKLIKDLLGYRTKKTRDQLLNILLSKWISSTKKNNILCTIIRIYKRNIVSWSMSMTRWNTIFKISCALEINPMDRMILEIWLTQLHKILSDSFKRLKN